MKGLLKQKRLVYFGLLLLFLFNLSVGDNVNAAENDFEVNQDGVLVNYHGAGGDVVIPAEVDGIQITSIGDSAFRGCWNLTSVNIPEGVTSIGDSAFSSCRNLTSVNISEGVTSIGNYAFFGCSSLTSIAIPSSITSIGDSVFYNCSNLLSINVSDKNLNYKDINNVLFSKDGKKLIQYPARKEDINYLIPSEVVSIEDSAFFSCRNLASVNIPEGVTNIEGYAFSGCDSLTSIVIPEGVTNIGDGAFSKCASLTSMIIYSDNVTLPYAITSALCDFSVILYGHKGSTTEAYALEHRHQFKEIENPTKPLTSISLTKTNITVVVGKSTLNSVVYDPADTTDDKTIKWTSSNPSVARVYTNGKVQGISQGTAVMTAQVGDLMASCTVTVN